MIVELNLFFKVIEANKEKSLSSRYFQTYTFYYSHINASDPYNKTHGHKIGDLDLFAKVTETDKGKMFVMKISPHLQFVFLPY